MKALTDKELQKNIISLKKTIQQCKMTGRYSAAQSAEVQLCILLELKAFRVGVKAMQKASQEFKQL
jgi:hypothetical protein